jgi:pimeloyl-ACP methyl ester carboxylesterase
MRIIFALLVSVAFAGVNAQNPFAGDWSGKLEVGVSMRLVLHIKDSTGIHATMDSPDQKAFGFKADNTIITGDSIKIFFNRIGGKYVAVIELKGDEPKLNGTWYQGGMQFPLSMERGVAPALQRPQTPKPPFNYAVEDVVYTNADKSVTLGGTITRPTATGKYPAIILITGSGQQDRDETILSHKPFWVIADHLTKNGFAVLRVDDRGMGKSKGELENVTSQDFANDVITSINYLKTRSDIDLKKIGLIGHSEGGMIAPMVAAKTKDVAFMVLLAGPAVRGDEVINEQRVAIMKASGTDSVVVREIDAIGRKIMGIVMDSKTKDEALLKAESATRQWASAARSDSKAVLNITSDDKIKTYVSQSINQLYVPWFRYFLQYDPAPALERSKCQVLAMYGEKDIQVIPSQNSEPMKRILSKSRKAGEFRVVEMKGLNHLFQKCNSCSLAEYGELTETFSEEALRVITDWLKLVTKK